MKMPRPVLPPRAMSESRVLLQPGPVLMSMAQPMISLKIMQMWSVPLPEAMMMSMSCAAARTVLIWVAMLPPEAMVVAVPMLLPRVMPGSIVLVQPESVLMSMAHVTSKGYADVHGLGLCLNPCRYCWAGLMLGACSAIWRHGDV